MRLHNRYLPDTPGGRRFDMMPQGPASIYGRSKLLQQLAHEMGYVPQVPRTFAASLKERLAKTLGSRSESLRQYEQAKKCRSKYSQIEAEQQAILDTFDPYSFPIEVVILAKQTVEAARLYLARIPEDGQFSWDDGQMEAESRAKTIERLEAWIKRLEDELRRIKNEIKATPGDEKLDNDYHAICEARSHAMDNMKFARSH